MNDTKLALLYLWRVRDAELELRRIEHEYKQARDDIMNLKAIEYDKDRVSNSRIGDLSDAIAALEGYAERLNAQWDKLIALREEARKQIAQIEDGRYREVLVRRYINGMTFERIAVDMRFDYRWTRRLHRRALAEFQRVISESDPRKPHSTCDIV